MEEEHAITTYGETPMTAANVRREFRLFHAILGLGLLIMSLQTLVHALRELHGDHRHLALVAGLEAAGAVLFLIPRTIRWGGFILLVVLLVGFAEPLTRGELELQRLVYAAGVWFLMRTFPQRVDQHGDHGAAQ